MNSKSTLKIRTLLNFAVRARKLIIGEAVVGAITNRKAKVIILATDCSQNTEKRILDKINTFPVECLRYSTKEELGDMIGKEEVSAIAILNYEMANGLKKLIKEGD